MVPRPLAAVRVMRSRTCADVVQPCLWRLVSPARHFEKWRRPRDEAVTVVCVRNQTLQRTAYDTILNYMPVLVNAADVGSTRDLISQKNV